MNRIQERGQALIETVISLPVLLLVLFALICAIKYAILSERLERDARYTQQILNSSNLYTEYSIPSLYDAINGTPSFMVVCATPPQELLTNPSGITNNGVTFSGSSLWKASSTSQSCSTGHQALLTNDGFTRDLLIGFQTALISANFTPSLGTLSTAVAPVTLHSQDVSNYQAASVADIELCYPKLFSSVSSSLANGETSSSQEFSATLASIQAVPASTNLSLDRNCINQSPKNASANPASQYIPPIPAPNQSSAPSSATTYG